MDATEVDLSVGRASGVLIGRRRELSELRESLGEAIGGHGRLVLVGGEPGIGKTRLAEELSVQASGANALVLWGRSWEGGEAPAFWPWAQILRGYVRGRPSAELAAELGVSAPFVVHLVPELRERLPDLSDTDLPRASEEARFALLDAVTRFLTSAAASVPLVLVLDDLHAADASSLLLLRFLARELTTARILVVGTYRYVGVAPAPDVAALLGDLLQGAQHITLRGLHLDEVTRFVAEASGSPPDAEAAASIHRATGGNPLFLAQVVRLLVGEGRLPLEGPLPATLPLPPGVREAIGARLALLPNRAADTLTMGSIIGDEPPVPLLQAVSGLDLDSLFADLARAVDAGLLVEQANGPARFRFAHALIREALHERLDAAAQTRLHRDVGRAIERLHESEPGPHLGALARHFCRAAPLGDAERGVGYAVRAGQRSMSQLAYEDAAAYYELALTTLELVAGPQMAQRCDILLGLGAAEQAAGRAERSRETFARAAALASELGDAERLARSALAFGAAEATAGAADDPGGDLLEEALAALPPKDSALRARVLARLARARYFGDRHERTAELCRQAVEMARRCGDRAALLEALCAEQVVTWSPDNVHDRLRSAGEIVALAESLKDRTVALQGRAWRRRHLLELGEVLAADHEMGVCERLANELRQPRHLWHVTNMRAGRALLAGRFDECERLAHEALEIGRAGRGPTAEATFLFQMRVVCAEQGRLEEVAPQIDRLAEQHAAWRVDPLYHLTKLERRAEVHALFERLAVRDFSDLPRSMFWLWDVAYLAEACVYLRDARRAALLYDLLLPYRDRCLVMGQSGGCEGALARYLGQLAATLERWEDAAAHFERALEIHLRMGARPLLAHTRHEYAVALLEQGRPDDRERANGMLAAALTTAEELGMTTLAERIRGAGEPPRRQASVFRRDGEYWTIGFQSPAFRLKDERGLAYIAYLLERPNEEVHALELAAACYPRASEGSTPNRLDQSRATRRLGLGDAGELLDPQAKAAYRQRLTELREELDQANSWGDTERAAKAAAEIDFLTEELARAVGLRGHPRRAASDAERARVSVTKAIRRASAKVAKHDTGLGDHLARTIRTGTFCSYTPGLPEMPRWVGLGPGPE